ncbi:M23 family metallopeptidase, partial [Tessaracoccus lubricantis]
LRAQVADLVAARDKAEAAARQQVVDEEARQRELQAENADVERRIQQRIEAQKKAAAEKAARDAAARKAAADKAARDAAARKAAAAKPAAPKPQAGSSSSKNSGAASSASSSRNQSTFIRPVDGRLTSKYGMRLHPVLGYRKLHDGTDFGAPCGAPIRAAAAGVVTERYYNAGYGNRLMIDHGLVRGSYVTTGYNHATRYIVGVGSRVKQGQVIGYVGSTGYSTGCHLHLMVWQNGRVVNPMAGWFN